MGENQFTTRLDLIHWKYVNTLKYSLLPMGKRIMSAAKWTTRVFSGNTTGYFVYWLITFLLPDLPGTNWWERVYWVYFIPTQIVGMALSVGMSAMKYRQTTRRVDKDLKQSLEDEKYQPSKKSFWRKMVWFEPNFGLLCMRFTSMAGTVAILFGPVYNYNMRVLHQTEYSEKINQERQAAKERIAALESECSKYIAKKTNGIKDDDANADSMLAILRGSLKSAYKRSGDLENIDLNMADAGNIVGLQKADGTAWVRILANGKEAVYYILLIIIFAMGANAIDACSMMIDESHAECDYHAAIKAEYDLELERYERELGLVSGDFGDGEAGSERDKSNIGNSHNVDFKNPNNMKILNRIKTSYRDDRGDGRGISLADIAKEFGVTREIPSRVRLAAIEEGLYDPEANKRKTERIGDAA